MFKINIICVDIDGVLAEENNGKYSIANQIKDAKISIDKLIEKGFKIYLHTGRHILKREETIYWLQKNNINYDHIVFNKPVAKYYIDDRAIRFNSWKEVLNKIEKDNKND